MGKVYCRYCGKQIDEDATFCTHCGKEQDASKKPSLDADGIRSTGESFIKKSLALIRSSFENVIRVNSPQINAERANLWCKRLKGVGKVVLAFLIIVIVFSIGAWGYDYYNNKYLPEKRLDEACADIINKMHSNDKSESIEYCRKVLLNRCAFINNEESWGYDNVPDLQITDRLSSYHNEAFGTIESEAFNGNPSVQFLLGHMYIGRFVQKYKIAGNSYYERVYSVEPDTTKAVYWWNEAAKQGFTLAYNSMGIAYKLGWGVDKDMKKAIEYLKKGAESGDAKAQCNYGDLFRFGVRVKVGTHKETQRHVGTYGWKGEKIQEYYDSNLMESVIISLVDVDDYEWLIPQDIEKARYWWEKAAEQGNEYAKDFLQEVYE